VWGTLAPVGRIEIISKTRLRTLLGIGSDEVVEVEVELG
jgi:CTP-dependent riboflavin kinase